MTDREARAARAQTLIDDPLLKEAFDSIEAEAVNLWSATGLGDTQKREWAWLMVKAVQRVRGNLEAIVTDGKFAAAQTVNDPLR